MPASVILYALILAASTVLAAGVAVLALRRHAAGQSVWLAAVMAGAAGWAAVAAAEALVPVPAIQVILSKIQYVAVVSVAPAWLMFALAYAGRAAVRVRPREALLWAPSIVTLALVWTNEWHGWVWRAIGDPPGQRGPLVYHHGPAVAAFAAYSYLLVLAGTALILRTAYRAPPGHRRHVIPVGVAALLPMVLNLSYLSGTVPAPGLDLTPVAFAVSGALLAWALTRQRFLSVPPVALAALFAGMREGVLVVSADGRIAAANPAARDMLGLGADPAGNPLGVLLADHPALLAAIGGVGARDLALPAAGGLRRFDVSVEPLGAGPAPSMGRLITLRDVTAEREAAEAIGRREAILDAVRETATRWLRHPAWRDGIRESLGRLGIAADVSRAYVFQAEAGAAGRVCISQLYEWTAAGVTPQIDNPRLQRTTFAALGHSRVETILAAGGIFSAITRDLPAAEQTELDAETIRAILLVPIFAFGRWWGFIGLDECRHDRAWADAETGALRTAAEAFGAAIEREDMDAQRRENAERLQFIMDSIPGILWAVDRDLNLTVLSGSALPAVGIASLPQGPVPIDGVTSKAGLGPDTLDRHRRVLAGECLDYQLELRGRRFDSHLRPLRGPGGAVEGAIGIALDITERTAAEEAVRRLTDRLLLAACSSGIGIWELNLASRDLFWDDRMREIYGWPAAAAVTVDAWLALVHPEDRDRLRREGEAALRTQTQVGFEHRIIRTDGSVRWIRAHGTVEKDAAGVPRRAVGTNLDITDIRRIERDQAKLATAVEQSAEVTVITDPDGRIEYVNPAFERTTGYRREEVLGRMPSILKSGRQDRALYEELWTTIRSGRTWTGHFVNRRKDGTLYEEDATISPVVDGTGRIVNFVAEKRDVTQERLLEAQLRQSQKMESVGRLAGGVAHDFNNNLQTILGFCELLLLQRAPGDPEREDILQIQRAADNARKLTAQLLAFSRRQLIQPAVLDLNVLIGEQQLLFVRTLGEDIRLDLRLAPGAARVKADPGQIQQVLLNLVVNARDAMPSGGRLLIATAHREFSAADEQPGSDVRHGRFVCLSVCDSGSGMSPETVAHLFEPFFTTKEAGKGTGLGLAVIHGIVKQHEGWIHVYTEPGQGTEFKVFLPAADQPAEPPAQPAPAAGSMPRGRGERLLLVEDEPGPRLMAARVLREHGYQVVEAGDAADARRIFGEEPAFALVISDVVLPDGNGVELTMGFREARPALPVVLMSGYADDRARWPDIRDRGMPFLQKPFSVVELLNTVARSLAKPAAD
jgi:PAS domain S-box-containing protein